MAERVIGMGDSLGRGINKLVEPLRIAEINQRGMPGPSMPFLDSLTTNIKDKIDEVREWDRRAPKIRAPSIASLGRAVTRAYNRKFGIRDTRNLVSSTPNDIFDNVNRI